MKSKVRAGVRLLALTFAAYVVMMVAYVACVVVANW